MLNIQNQSKLIMKVEKRKIEQKNQRNEKSRTRSKQGWMEARISLSLSLFYHSLISVL